MTVSIRAGLAALLGLALVSGASAQSAAERVAPQTRAEALLSFSGTVKKAAPAVVNVYASRTEAQPRNPLFDDPVFRRFFGDGAQGPGERTAQSLGSGVIVESNGLVITNNHVIENMTDVKVALSDRREYPADIVLRDPRTDLAVLRLKGAGSLPAIEVGDSDALEVGDLVLAIGNPFGVGQTVTQGIVSALARTQIGITDYGFFIQTDAAINPGNSGGALIDSKARLIGINSAIFSKSGGSVGIGFAIPVNMVKIVVAAAKSGGKQVRRPWLGASLQVVSKEIADSIGLDRPVGALVADMNPKGPAADAGLKRGDVIMAVDGQSVDDPEGLGYRMGTKPIGGVTEFSVMRSGKKTAVSRQAHHGARDARARHRDDRNALAVRRRHRRQYFACDCRRIFGRRRDAGCGDLAGDAGLASSRSQLPARRRDPVGQRREDRDDARPRENRRQASLLLEDQHQPRRSDSDQRVRRVTGVPSPVQREKVALAQQGSDEGDAAYTIYVCRSRSSLIRHASHDTFSRSAGEGRDAYAALRALAAAATLRCADALLRRRLIEDQSVRISSAADPDGAISVTPQP